MSDSETPMNFSIIDSKMTIKAMRDSGYKSTTHALAELIDNSIDSHATAVEVFGVSIRNTGTGRHTLKELAVLDNGEGMDSDTLRGSLRYGHGTRRSRRGIGRYGLGLPNSSMSQARRVDVWSWQSGETNALHTWLCLDHVESGMSVIPEPAPKRIPRVYRESTRIDFGDSGTLVVWSDLDRVEWKQVSTTFRHTEMLVGRIYRRYLARQSERLHPGDTRGEELGQQRSITFIPIRVDNDVPTTIRESIVEVRPNDPLYLMTESSCPEDFGPGPMFKELPGSPFLIPVEYRGQEYSVRVRASYARPHVRDSSAPEANWPSEWVGHDAGNTRWGKHAAQNMGVSLVRAHREIQLDKSWISGDDPRERWWTVEVDFPTELDEVFGVTNNKQSTVTFERIGQFHWKREALSGEESIGDVRRRMEQDGDPRARLLELRKQIGNVIRTMRPRVREARQRRGPRHVKDENQIADERATAVIKRRINDGHEGESDRAGQTGSAEDHQEVQVESLTEKHHFDRADALRRIDETIRAGNRVRWIESAQSHAAFFEVEALPNVIQVALNTNHPVHSHLYDILHPYVQDLTEDEVRERLMKAAAAFRILIYSWARFEEEQIGRQKRHVRNARWEWGKYAEEFFDEDDDSAPPTDRV